MLKKDNLCNAINLALTETLEEMAFMETCQVEGDTTYLRNNNVEVLLKVTQPISLKFILSMEIELLKEIATNILAVDEDNLTHNMQTDVISEILNTISGKIMKKIIPKEQSFDLGIPTVNKNNYENQESFVTCNFGTVDHKKILFSVYTN